MDKTTFYGLTKKEAALSRKKYGENKFEERKAKSFISIFLSGFCDPIVEVLLAAIIINIVFSFKTFHWYETLGIILAVVVSTFVSALSEKGSERAFSKMQEASKKTFSNVIRDGKTKKLPSSEIVVGDFVFLSAGNIIPADGKIVNGEIKVDQSAINGESKEVKKYPKGTDTDILSPSSLFQGTLVSSGSGIMQVEKIGGKTFFGKIAGALQEEKTASPLKKRLSVLAKEISKLGYISAFIVGFISLFNSFVIEGGFNKAEIILLFQNPRYVFSAILSALALGITVVVVAVPEGLPMMISVVLSANMKKMMKQNVLVRKPVGIETAGSMNILFTDKTGTLTEGKQVLSEVLLGSGTLFSAKEMKKTSLYKKFSQSILSTSECTITKTASLGSNSTDRALSDFCRREEPEKKPIKEKIPFDSAKKYSKTEFRDGTGFIKGAPEILIPKTNGIYLEDGKISESFDKNYLFSLYSNSAASGKRVIFIGETVGEKLYLIAFALISDRIRSDAAKSVLSLRNAGIKVIMITGDGEMTACKIARDCGILKDGEKAVSGEDIRNMTDEKLKKELKNIKVIFRLYPDDKKRLVKIAKDSGYIVGMTGDGINDAPALKISDVGFAMQSGTDVAKEASDIVLTDDSLFSVSKAVLYGRTVFESIRKFIVFQLSMNFIAVGITVIAPLFGIDNPISIMQMLWINLIMDTLGGLAFAGEIPKKEYMLSPPKSPKEKIMTRDMISHIAFISVFSVAYLLLFLFLPITRKFFLFGENYPYFMTVFFSLFIFIAVINSFNVRTERLNIFSNLFKNKAFCLVMLFVTFVQYLIIFYGGKTFSTVPISHFHFILTFLSAQSVIIADTLRKYIIKRKKIQNLTSA